MKDVPLPPAAVRRLIPQLLRHEMEADHLRVDTTGERVAVGIGDKHGDGRIVVWNLALGTERIHRAEEIEDWAFTDGLLAVRTREGVRLLDPDTWEERAFHAIEGAGSFSSRGDRFANLLKDRWYPEKASAFTIRATRTGEVIRECAAPVQGADEILLSADGSVAAIRDLVAEEVVVIDTVADRELYRSAIENFHETRLALSPDGHRLAMENRPDDREQVIVDVTTGAELYRGPERLVAFGEDGSTFIGDGNGARVLEPDGTVRWSTESPAWQAWRGAGRWWWYTDASLEAADEATGTRVLPEGPNGHVFALAVEADGSVTAWGGAPWCAFRLADGTVTPMPERGHPSPNTSPDGSLAVQRVDRQVVVTRGGGEVARLPIDAWTLVFSPDGRWLLAHNFSGRLLADTTTWATQVPLEKLGRLNRGAFHGPFAVLLFEDPVVRLYDPETQKQLSETPLPNTERPEVAASDGGERVAIGTADGIFVVRYDAAGTVLSLARGASGAITSVAWTPAGALLAGDRHGVVTEWDTDRFETIGGAPRPALPKRLSTDSPTHRFHDAEGYVSVFLGLSPDEFPDRPGDEDSVDAGGHGLAPLRKLFAGASYAESWLEAAVGSAAALGVQSAEYYTAVYGEAFDAEPGPLKKPKDAWFLGAFPYKRR